VFQFDSVSEYVFQQGIKNGTIKCRFNNFPEIQLLVHDISLNHLGLKANQFAITYGMILTVSDLPEKELFDGN
jgi:hypothetical protein